MALSAVKRFRGVLEPASNGLGWVIVWLPFEIEKAWKKMVRLRVKVETGGEIFRTSLFGDSVRGGHFVLVNKKMQRAAGAKVGAMVDLAIEPDLDEREAVVTQEFESLLKGQKKLAKWYGELSESRQRDVGKWLGAVKSVDARQRRAEQVAEWMLLTMEGEKILPPVRSGVRSGACCAQGMGGDDLDTAAEQSACGVSLSEPGGPREAREKAS